eukprot:COSAG02_NODE_12300_length_1566_cov_1.074301_1_plen_159_part_00
MHGAGTPTGSCATGFKANPSCDFKAAKAKIEKECIGKSSCSIPASTAFFGNDPCFDTVKSLAISATGCNAGSKPAVFTYDVTIPAGSVRTIATASHSGIPIAAWVVTLGCLSPALNSSWCTSTSAAAAANSPSHTRFLYRRFHRLPKFTCQRWGSRPP